MTNAVSYLRVSGESQIDRGGFPRQVEDVKLFCEHSDFNIIHEYRGKSCSWETRRRAPSSLSENGSRPPQ